MRARLQLLHEVGSLRIGDQPALALLDARTTTQISVRSVTEVEAHDVHNRSMRGPERLNHLHHVRYYCFRARELEWRAREYVVLNVDRQQRCGRVARIEISI